MSVRQVSDDLGHRRPWQRLSRSDMSSPMGKRAASVRREASAGSAPRVVIVCYDDVELLDVAGPANVFTAATRLAGAAYDVELVAPCAGAVRTAGGVELVAHRSLGEVREVIDTLLVPGGMNVLSPGVREVSQQVKKLARRAR